MVFWTAAGSSPRSIATRAMNPFPALVLVASCEAAGLFVLGHAVARTVGLRLFAFPCGRAPEKILWVLVCALIGALGWNLLMWRLSLPSSSSHAMIGGLLGASLVGFGVSSIRVPVAVTILILLGIGPWVAAATSFLLCQSCFAGRVNGWSRR